MPYRSPRLGTARLQLRFAFPHGCRLALRENVAHIHQPLRLHRETAMLNRYLDKVSFLEFQGFEGPLRNYNLTALPNPANGCQLCLISDGHHFRLADERTLSRANRCRRCKL